MVVHFLHTGTHVHHAGSVCLVWTVNLAALFEENPFA
jgi:hypothetical protein